VVVGPIPSCPSGALAVAGDPNAITYSYTDLNWKTGVAYFVTTVDLGPAGTARESTPAKQYQAPLTLIATSPLTYNSSESLSTTGGTTNGTVTYYLLSGPCSLTGSQLKANSGTGSCLVTATMAGSSSYDPVTSAAVTISVQKANTTTTVNSSAATSILNASVTFTATVLPQYSGVPTGTVTFQDGSNTIGTGTLNGTGIATYTTSTLTVNSHPITAVYGGDGSFTGSSGSMTQNVQYVNGGVCAGDVGHAIRPPINADGSSVWKQGSTVSAKFAVCDANGASIGSSGVITSFVLYKTSAGTTSPVDETADNSTNDSGWHFDPTARQWIFNMSTKTAPQNVANRTYYYQINLNDGSNIQFHFGLK
jgi:hypothetical protein